MFALIQYPVGVLVGGALTTWLIAVFRFPFDLLAMLAVVVLSALGARRVPTVRHFAGGMGVGVALLTVSIAVVLVVRVFL